MPKPSELEPRESEVADAPLLDRAEPVAEQRSSPRRRLSRSLDVEMGVPRVAFVQRSVIEHMPFLYLSVRQADFVVMGRE